MEITDQNTTQTTTNELNTTTAVYKTVVIYHGGCPDGLAAAWVFTNLTAEAGFGPIYYHYTSERDFDKDNRMPDLRGKQVYIVDYSYPRAILQRISGIARGVVVLDHHETAQKELSKPIPGVLCVFDMSRCGAEISWDYIMVGRGRPWWFQHIRDRDLWIWEHPDSYAFGAALMDKGLSFETLNTINAMNDQERADFIQYGRNLVLFQTKEITSLCRSAQLVCFEGYPVNTLNCIKYISDVGNQLCKKPECKFAFIYRYDMIQHMWYISLRGVAESNINLSLIAKKYGGGGHPLAAGFTYKGNLNDIISEWKDGRS